MGTLRVSIAFLICFHCSTAERPEQVADSATELPVNVAVYNGVNLPTDQLIRAERETTRIFQYAGIELKWASGLLNSKIDTPSEKWNPLTLQLRIWPRAATGKWPAGADAMGFCLSLDDGDAVILSDAVRNNVVLGGPDFADLLGLAMAHELGHLLLRSAGHSVTGIMRARFTQKMLRDDARGFFRFNPREAEFMQKEVSRRIALIGTLPPQVNH